jgi:RNA polymerase sigma-70 factor (sigma-E family)
MEAEKDEEFTAYVAASAVRLRRMAYLLCGDWQRAEDEVQAALVKLYLVWTRVRTYGSLDAYVRKTLVRGLIDEHRRPWRRERAHAEVPDQAMTQPLPLEDRLAVREALALVPPRQRAVLVLRYYEECDVAETARLVGCSEGTVKSQTARGLTRLPEIVPQLNVIRRASNAKARSELGRSPRTDEDAVAATGESLIRLGLLS